jgi:hypothetical protein
MPFGMGIGIGIDDLSIDESIAGLLAFVVRFCFDESACIPGMPLIPGVPVGFVAGFFVGFLGWI